MQNILFSSRLLDKPQKENLTPLRNYASFTVGIGITPIPAHTNIGSRALPPVGNHTLPQSCSTKIIITYKLCIVNVKRHKPYGKPVPLVLYCLSENKRRLLVEIFSCQHQILFSVPFLSLSMLALWRTVMSTAAKMPKIT